MFQIDYKRRSPLYEQLMDNIRTLVLAGALRADESLPSVRQLSATLGINPNTVQKAYVQLEQQGVIYTVPGKGNFVSPNTETLRGAQQEKLLSDLYELAVSIRQAGVAWPRAADRLAQAYGRGKEEEHD